MEDRTWVRIEAADWLNATAREALRPATAAAAAVSGVLAVLNPFLLPPEAVVPLTLNAACVALFNAVLAILVRRRPPSVDWAHPLGAAIAIVAAYPLLLALAGFYLPVEWRMIRRILPAR